MIFLYVLSLLAILITLLPLTLHTHWSVRVFDFPRVQIIAATLLILLAYLVASRFLDRLPQMAYVFILLLVIVLIYQIAWIFRYTPLSRAEVNRTSQYSLERSIRLMSVNVLQSNTHYQAVIDLVEKHRPNILITLETNTHWQEQLSALASVYPYRVNVPQDNLYGMHLFSEYPLADTQVHYRIREDIPSITTRIMLSVNGRSRPVTLYCLHPMPPSPTESPTSLSRDQELILVANEIAEQSHPCIVAGDLNDVAWSKTTRLFRKVSSLLDPRIGRGFFNTFHAGIPLLRWPLDHVFHSHHFTLNAIRRLPYVGSDHFPILVDVQLEEESQKQSDKKADSELDAHEEELLEHRMNNIEPSA